ncbi:hypothetical protein EW145_g6267 [Phellinidium pouzarii]|uniref:Phospholipase A-2-activating protein n=1 Tax=Phellinidium pouzarii TaxID=167371 RepID=A0A4S4KX37_9AGAM|nr:hypothetical protein EW145_g6267 [Phellinidium pouzarii]
MPYKLSASLHAHSSDVRAVASPIDTLVLSASRDNTALSWTRLTPSAPFVQESVFHPGSKYINAIAYIPPSPEAPKGYAVTGGVETVINVYSLDAPSEPKYALVGHTENVCALNTSPSGLVISGSWDRTAKVWRDFQQLYELRGHEQSVWAVHILDEDAETYLTASADNTIKMWMRNKLIRTFTGHTSAVRGLALMPHIGFASCSNDGEIRVWTLEGDVVFTLSGHTSFVYSLTVLPTGEIASGGEDRTLRVWRDEECVQTIAHPATSVWAVSSMPNGDIVTGSSDGIVRVFSAAEERWATTDKLKDYDDQVASQTLPSQQVGDVKKTDLPGPETLTEPGKKPGEVKMVRNGESVEAHQWNPTSMSWQKIGEVVDAVGSGRKQLHGGKEYDYVFDVDIQDGVPPLKLPYNVNENPYAAAQRFLAANDLPMSYLDQIVQFIERNTSAVNLSSGTDFVDPFTGASRYQPSRNSVPTQHASTFVDPFTGSSRYTPQPSSALLPTAQLEPVAIRAPSVIPVNTFLSFKQGNVNAMRGKIRELDEAFRNEISTLAVAIYPPESTKLDEAYTFLSQAFSSPDNITAQPPNKTHLETILQVLERWPSSTRFPGMSSAFPSCKIFPTFLPPFLSLPSPAVIDLARLVSGYCPSAYADSAVAEQFFTSLLKAAEWDAPWETPIPKSRETNILLALRAVANALQEGTQPSTVDWVSLLLRDISTAPYDVLMKNHRVTLATSLFNLSCVRLKGPIPSTVSDQYLALLSTILRQERNDAETAYRALVALGNTLYALRSQSGKLTAAQISEFRQELPALTARFPEERIGAVINDVEGLL